MPKNIRNEINEKLSDHEKQFVYLPLNILKGATNIGELLIPTLLKGETKWLDYTITEVHKQMPTKCGRWFPELANLRFIESIVIEDDDVPNTNENVTESKPKSNSPTTTMPKDAPKALVSNETSKQSSVVNIYWIVVYHIKYLCKINDFQSDLSSDRDNSANNKSKNAVTTPIDNVKGNVAENKKITRGTFVPNAIDQTPQSSARALRKRKVIYFKLNAIENDREKNE